MAIFVIALPSIHLVFDIWHLLNLPEKAFDYDEAFF